jgi:hypothetical protein
MATHKSTQFIQVMLAGLSIQFDDNINRRQIEVLFRIETPKDGSRMGTARRPI